MKLSKAGLLKIVQGKLEGKEYSLCNACINVKCLNHPTHAYFVIQLTVKDCKWFMGEENE